MIKIYNKGYYNMDISLLYGNKNTVFLIEREGL